MIHTAGFRGVKRLLSEELGLAELGTTSELHVRFRSSDAVRDRTDGRHGAEDARGLVCWIHDIGPEKVIEVGPLFSRMSDPPPDGVRPKLARF